MVIEKAKVDAEVLKLARLRAEYDESRFSHRRRIVMLQEDATGLERRIAAMKRDLEVRRDTRGDKFVLTVDGKTFTDRNQAGAVLVYRIEDHKTGHLLGRSAPAVLGELAGFKVEFRSTVADKLLLRGETEYAAKVTDIPAGTIASLEHAVRSIDENLKRTCADLDRTKQDRASLSSLASGVWEHEEHYRDLLNRQAELVEALDISKNQASAQLDAAENQTETPVERIDVEETVTASVFVAVKPSRSEKSWRD